MKKLETHPSSQSGSWLRRLVREPLVPFQVLGGLLFGAWYAFNDQPQIVLDEAHVASIVATFQRTWLRLPTHEDLASRVEDRIKEEILYWEALALGLDRSVTV
jgi:peptidyl-prolyl cis-trans isomerase C